MTTKIKKALAAGYGLAVAGLARDHGEETLAAFLLADSGMDVADFEASGLDEYDLSVLQKLFKTDDYLKPKPAKS